MSNIKFKLRRTSDAEGNTLTARVSHIASDLPALDHYELLYILHALTLVHKVQLNKLFTLNESYLDSEDYLG